MPGPANGSFATAGATPGSAASWNTVIVSNGWIVGDFSGGGGAAPLSVETFTHATWLTDPFESEVISGIPADFDQGEAPVVTTTESFTYFFANNFFQWFAVQLVDASFAPSGGPEEGFEEGFSNDTFLTELAPGDLGASFTEDFEDGSWSDDVGASTLAVFDQGTQNVEDFEEVVTDVLFIVDEVADVFTAIDPYTLLPVVHGMPLNLKVTTGAESARPRGLTFGVQYYVINIGGGGTTFQLSRTPGGAAVGVTDQGVGKQWLHADETAFWTNPVGADLDL